MPRAELVAPSLFPRREGPGADETAARRVLRKRCRAPNWSRRRCLPRREDPGADEAAARRVSRRPCRAPNWSCRHSSSDEKARVQTKPPPGESVAAAGRRSALRQQASRQRSCRKCSKERKGVPEVVPRAEVVAPSLPPPTRRSGCERSRCPEMVLPPAAAGCAGAAGEQAKRLPRVRQEEGCAGMSRGAACQCRALRSVLRYSSPSRVTRGVVLAAEVKNLSPPSARLRRADGDLRREVLPERRPITVAVRMQR
eukprot:COSAG01_NODE_2673_length_7266_cov_24.715920_1_plen_255_part_00